MILVRILLLVTLLAAAAVVFYGLVLDRTGQAIAFTVAGLFVLGVTLVVISVGFAIGAVGAGRAGHGFRAIFGGLVGGLFALAAAGSLAGAMIFALLTRTV